MSGNEPGQPSPQRDVTVNDWTIDLDTPVCALAIGAHPDDVEFGAGATLAKWAAAGCTVHHVICTDGSKGSWDPAADIDALVDRRRHEQREAAHRLSGDRAGTTHFMGYVDGDLDNTRQARSELSRLIRTLKPSVVLAHDPWKRYRLHPDHRAAGFLACDSVVAARDPHFFPEHDLAHHRPDQMLLWEADSPNHAEDAAFGLAAKLAALEAHESQFESTMHAGTEDELEMFRQRITARLAVLGENVGLEFAEVFHLIDDL